MLFALLGHFYIVLSGSAGRIGKSISAKIRIYTKCFAFLELILQTLRVRRRLIPRGSLM